MRVERQITVDAPREEVWELIADPANYPRFMAAITQFETDDGAEPGAGARYSMRMRVGSADIGGLVEVVEFDPPRDMAWTSVMGIDQRGRWRVRDAEDGSTRVTLRLSYTAPGGLLGTLADRLAAPAVGRNLADTLENLKRELEGEPQVSEAGMSLPARVMHDLGSVKVLIDAAVVRPIRPDKLVRMGRNLMRWGRTPAAGYETAAVLHPDEPAIVDELGTLTFRDVQERTNRLAHALADQGIKEGDGVGVMCRNHRGFVEAIVALSKLGADALLLNTAFSGPQLTEVTKREKPAGLIFDEEFYGLLKDAGTRRKRFVAWHDSETCDDPTLDDLIAEGDSDSPVPPEREGRVTILTSGTTGTPKGAGRAAAQSLDPAIAFLSKIPLKSRQVSHIAAPLFHSWGFAHFTIGMLLGTTYVLRRKFDPEECLAEIARYRCDSLVVVPVMMQRILQLPEETRRKYDTSSLTAVCASGSALPGDLASKWMDEFGDTLYNLYGSTEVAWATIATPQDMRAAPGTAGRVPRGTIVKLYDEQGRLVPEGDTGRIFVGNEMLFEGYTGGGTKDEIDGLMSTGDVGRFDDAGRMFVEGRDDEMIVSGGENVFPKEIEDLLARYDGVAEAAAIGVEDEEFGQRLRAFVVTKGGASVSEDDLKGHVKKNLARYKVPREIVFLDELPRNATGKVLKRELKEWDEKGEKAGKK
jgi:fatty-acyl-CoA synthase